MLSDLFLTKHWTPLNYSVTPDQYQLCHGVFSMRCWSLDITDNKWMMNDSSQVFISHRSMGRHGRDIWAVAVLLDVRWLCTQSWSFMSSRQPLFVSECLRPKHRKFERHHWCSSRLQTGIITVGEIESPVSQNYMLCSYLFGSAFHFSAVNISFFNQLLAIK